MKTHILLILLFLLSCNAKNNTEKRKIISNDSILMQQLDTLPKGFGTITTNLPYGSKIISEYEFPKEWHYTSILSDAYNPDLLDNNSKKINTIDSLLSSKHSLNNKWNTFYKIDTIDYDVKLKTIYKNAIPSNFHLIEVLPNIQNVNVVLRSYDDETKGIHLIDLFTINMSNDIIDDLNIYYSISGDLHTSYKFFNINKKYKIDIKKFEVYDDQTNFIDAKRYKINKNGKIVLIQNK